jgi:hypothetical protein
MRWADEHVAALGLDRPRDLADAWGRLYDEHMESLMEGFVPEERG